MVWFQCEVCGENLKKPKLPTHFRICSASKLSCIDCGQTFGQQSVQGHTQCITEAEKYGPKGQGKTPNSANAKANKDSKPQPDFDITVGLSKRPPWFCSLCNTKATTEQTLLLHAEGKKHRGKAKGYHASMQQTKPVEESALVDKPSTLNTPKKVEPKVENLPKEDNTNTNFEADNGNLSSKKKRKHDESEKNGAENMIEGDSNGEVVQVGKTENGETKTEVKKAKHDDTKKKPKLKKLITSALKSNPDGVLKLKKLKKIVTKMFQEPGMIGDEAQLSDKIEQEINSSSRFTVDKKYVRLAAKD